jgi:uncharacterized protein (DUF433 family)
MTLNDELQTRKHVEEPQKSTRTNLTFAYAHRQIADAKEAVTFGAPRIQDRLVKVWTALLPVKREDMSNDKLWADLVAIKNRMVFYNPAGLKPDRMKASLSLMRTDHADALKEMICRLDSDVRATA